MVRLFIVHRRIKYSSYEQYLETKTKIIATQLRHFYTIHTKFDKIRRHGGSTDKADNQMDLLEKVFTKLMDKRTEG